MQKNANDVGVKEIAGLMSDNGMVKQGDKAFKDLGFTGEGIKKCVEGGIASVCGSDDIQLLKDMVSLGVSAVSSKDMTGTINTLIGFLADYKPQNNIEARLCTQAYTLFSQGMKYMAKAENQDMMCHADHYMKYALKLLRLHNETIVALDRLHRGGEQKVIVQHVNVEGGQAAFMTGNFQVGGGVKEKNERGTS